MSDHAAGPGWWLASDGRWYPPEARPGPERPGTPPAPAPVASTALVERSSASSPPVAGAPDAPSWPADDAELPELPEDWSPDEEGFPWQRDRQVRGPVRRRWRSWWVVTGVCLLFLLCSGAAVVVLVDGGDPPRGTGLSVDEPGLGPPAVRPTDLSPEVLDGADPGSPTDSRAPGGEVDVPDPATSPTWHGHRDGDLLAEVGTPTELTGVVATAAGATEVIDPSPVDEGRFLRVELTLERSGGEPLLYNDRLDLVLVDADGAATGAATLAVASLGSGVLAPGEQVSGFVYFPLGSVAAGAAHVVYEPDTSRPERAIWSVAVS
ncbi:MAG: hypothetical protein S0880_32035 [Actinomycetota bacterium]|nr:hypothetical protein [Actinomycetota bacterium]